MRSIERRAFQSAAVKEVGEGSTLPITGCYADAIYDAIGVRIYDLPLTPEKVWRAIQERKEKS